MNIEGLIEAAPDWTDQTWAQRMDAAASLLFLHGYIPQSQRERIARKMNNQFADGIADGLIVERSEATTPASEKAA